MTRVCLVNVEACVALNELINDEEVELNTSGKQKKYFKKIVLVIIVEDKGNFKIKSNKIYSIKINI